MVLGFLLGLIGYSLLEKAYINKIISSGEVLAGINEGCFLLPNIAVIFFVDGIALGYILGVRWWQIVYVEKLHWGKR